jgi:hypothetical protein
MNQSRIIQIDIDIFSQHEAIAISFSEAASEAVIPSLYLQRGNDSEKATSKGTSGADDLSRATSKDGDGR